MKFPEAILFDMDGVIVDNNRYHTEAWIEFGRRYKIPVTADEINTLFGNTNKEILNHFFRRELDSKIIRMMAGEKEQIYRNLYSKSIIPAPGLIPLLDSIQKEGIPMAVATSGPAENLRFVLKHTGTAKYFNITIDDSSVSRGKPDPEVFLRTAEALSVNPTQCIVFEDSVFGIEAALAAEMRVIALTTTYPPERLNKAHRIISSFTEINLEELKRTVR